MIHNTEREIFETTQNLASFWINIIFLKTKAVTQILGPLFEHDINLCHDFALHILVAVRVHVRADGSQQCQVPWRCRRC